MPCYGLEGIKFYLRISTGVLIETIPYIPEFLASIEISGVNDLIILLFLGALVFGYCLPFILWLIKQSILRAWSISLLGLFFGFGILSFANHISSKLSLMGVYIFIIICLFYLIIYFGDKYQSRYFPDNKFANKIRYLPTWPCLRTKSRI